jgi:hypothetical protein
MRKRNKQCTWWASFKMRMRFVSSVFFAWKKLAFCYKCEENIKKTQFIPRNGLTSAIASHFLSKCLTSENRQQLLARDKHLVSEIGRGANAVSLLLYFLGCRAVLRSFMSQHTTL